MCSQQMPRDSSVGRAEDCSCLYLISLGHRFKSGSRDLFALNLGLLFDLVIFINVNHKLTLIHRQMSHTYQYAINMVQGLQKMYNCVLVAVF